MVRNGCAEMKGGLSQALKGLVRGHASLSAKVMSLQETSPYQETASIVGPGGEHVLWPGPTHKVSDPSS